MTTAHNTRRTLSRNTTRNRRFQKAFEAMEPRQLMSASAVKSVDSGGPDHMMVEANGTLYVISSNRSGGGWEELYATKGDGSTTKLLVDLNKAGSKISSLDDLTATADGRIYFTAVGGTGGGRQLFQLNTSKGTYTQVTSKTQAFYVQTQVIGNTIYLYDSTNTEIVSVDGANKTKFVVDTDLVKMFQAKGTLFYSRGDAGVFRTDGTANGTYKISGDYNVGSNDIFVSNDHIYFEGTLNNNSGLYRSDGTTEDPFLIADDFSFHVNKSAEIGDWVYMAGAYYSTSPNSMGGELYRISTSTGEFEAATNLPNGNGGGDVDGISAIGTSIYFTAGDGEFITSQGTTDRELYRYDTVTGNTVKVTANNDVYPVEVGAGVLSSYYFVAAPTKDDARFGSRALYRTSPTSDDFELVSGMPSYQDSNNVTRQLVGEIYAGSSGFYFEARNMDFPGDYDTYFVATPFTYVDQNTNDLVVNCTANADTLDIKVDGDDLVLTLNGNTERQPLSGFGKIYIDLKAGDDRLTTDANVFKNMDIKGDSGNDTMVGGSGNDSLLGGSGKNFFYGMAGNDRLRGGNGYDWMNGGDDKDRLYGRGGGDNMRGGNGVDYLYGDDNDTQLGNDTLAGDQSADRLYGYGGDDLLAGGTQNDQLFGGPGNDTLQGQAGDDELDDGTGIDELWGLDGADLLISTDGELDKLYGGDGHDTSIADEEEAVIDTIEQLA